MKSGTIISVVLLSAASPFFVRSLEGETTGANSKPQFSPARGIVSLVSLAMAPAHLLSGAPKSDQRYPWKKQIVTTIFWIGESPSGNNPVPNRSSSWDKNWAGDYGGFDDPNPSRRQAYIPVK